MGYELIALGLRFPFSFVLASTVAVMVVPVMTVVMTAGIVVTTVVPLRCFRWTVASWACVLMLCWYALIITVYFLTDIGSGRRLRRQEESDFASSCCGARKAEAGGAFSCLERVDCASLG